MTYPATYELTHQLSGSIVDEFIRRSITENTESYRIDDREGIVLKRYEDGIEEPADMASYALHHLQRLKKTDSVTDETKLVFSDLTAEEIAATFVKFTDPAQRDQLRSEIKYGSLLEHALWVADSYQQGCVKCAPYLQRQLMKPYPDRPIQFVSAEAVPTFAFRERNMAYRILMQALDNPN